MEGRRTIALHVMVQASVNIKRFANIAKTVGGVVFVSMGNLDSVASLAMGVVSASTAEFDISARTVAGLPYASTEECDITASPAVVAVFVNMANFEMYVGCAGALAYVAMGRCAGFAGTVREMVSVTVVESGHHALTVTILRVRLPNAQHWPANLQASKTCKAICGLAMVSTQRP